MRTALHFRLCGDEFVGLLFRLLDLLLVNFELIAVWVCYFDVGRRVCLFVCLVGIRVFYLNGLF